MTEALKEVTKVEPDLLGYHARELADLLSHYEEPFVDTQTSEISKEIHGSLQDKKTYKGSASFMDSVGAGFTDTRKAKLKVLLRRCVQDLSPEVDGMLEQVLDMCKVRSLLRNKDAFIALSTNGTVESCSSAEHTLPKEPKTTLSSSQSVLEPASSTMCEEGDDLQFLLESDIKDVEKVIKKQSDELLDTLDNMKQQVEKFFDAVMSTSRAMTHTEKRDLQKLIQKLPSRNLDRIAEIVQRHHTNTVKQSCDEMFVDLEQLDNATLWRLWLYVEAVKSARKLVT